MKAIVREIKKYNRVLLCPNDGERMKYNGSQGDMHAWACPVCKLHAGYRGEQYAPSFTVLGDERDEESR